MTRNALFSVRKSITALLLLILLLPLSRLMSPKAVIDSGDIFLAWMPVSVMMAVILIFGRLAILPIIIVLVPFFFVVNSLYLLQLTVLILCIILPLVAGCALMRLTLGTRWRYGMPGKGMGVRLLVLGFITPCAIKFSMYFSSGWIDFPPGIIHYFGRGTTLFIIVDVLGLSVAITIFTFFFYYPLRMLLSPAFARSFWYYGLASCFLPCRRAATVGWLAMLAALLITLCWPTKSFLVSGYLVPLIFIVFTIGIRHFALRTIHIMWAFSTWLLLMFSENFLYGIRTGMALAFILSVFFSFTVCLLYISTLYRKSVWMRRIYYAQAITDPMTQLPNLRALERHLQHYPEGVLCCLRMSNLEFLSRHYGMTMRIHCKQQVTQILQPWLHEAECVFQLPGSELLIYLRGPEPHERLSHMVDVLNSRKISWNNDLMDMEYGVAWADIYHLAADALQHTLGQLGWLAEQACIADSVLALNHRQEAVSDITSEQVRLLRQVKNAMDKGSLQLYAQPIHDSKGQGYSEILCRIVADDGFIVMPDKFIGIVAEFNLSARFDMQIMTKLLEWLHDNPSDTPGTRFSVNLMPFTLMQKDIARDIVLLFERYGVLPEAVIIEVTEAQAFSDSHTSMQNIKLLRDKGFRIAIDDFGTGYANYERLKNLHADIIKIDGYFIRDITSNTLDTMIVKSICELARVKSMTVVAEYVENELQRDILLGLGVDYLQGWLIGKPEPLKPQSAGAC